MNNITIVIIYASAWIATAIAVIFGIRYTNSAWCLWALFEIKNIFIIFVSRTK